MDTADDRPRRIREADGAYVGEAPAGASQTEPQKASDATERPFDRVFRRVYELIRQLAEEHTWPLARVEFLPERDPEVRGWKYTLVVLVFESTFEQADAWLHELYGRLDALNATLSPAERNALRRSLFFDVKTARPVRPG